MIFEIYEDLVCKNIPEGNFVGALQRVEAGKADPYISLFHNFCHQLAFNVLIMPPGSGLFV
jgi:hypothetical protein